VDFASVALVLSEAMSGWVYGAPNLSLAQAMVSIDAEVAKLLELLVEVARAAQSRSVDPNGLHNGLKRATRSLTSIQTLGADLLIRILCGSLPGEPSPQPMRPEPHDDLSAAFKDGRPLDALPWLHAQQNTLPHFDDAMCRGAGGADPQDLVDAFLRGIAETSERRPHLASVSATCAAACLVASDRANEAIRLSEQLMKQSLSRRNGIGVAHAALIAMEAHTRADRIEEAERFRFRAGCLCHRLGAEGALTLLARWSPSEAAEGADSDPQNH